MGNSATAINDSVLRRGSSRRTASIAAAIVFAAWMACWIASMEPIARSFDGPSPEPTPFNIRFAVDLASAPSEPFALRYSAIEGRFEEAKRLLAEKLRAGDRLAGPGAAAPPLVATSVPLPKARPAQANLELQLARTDPPDSRSFLQKLADLLPARNSLASLTPGDDTPDLRTLGYDGVTAVYDISARAVYLPNGSRLEAHSGYGSLRDDPGHVTERNVGATPPAVYELKPREELFHGVPALRMIPAQGSAALGRDGLLAHSYMLGPDGDSNGCVSIRDYDKFLAAYQKGEIVRLVVVPSLTDAARQPLLKS